MAEFRKLTEDVYPFLQPPLIWYSSAGVGLFGTLSSFVAVWFLRPDAAAKESETKVLLQEVKAVREKLARQKSDNSV